VVFQAAHIQRLRNDLSLYDNYESRPYSYGRKCERKGELPGEGMRHTRGNVSTERSCPEEPGTNYEIPRNAHHKLHGLAVRMSQVVAARSFADELQDLLGQVICVIED